MIDCKRHSLFAWFLNAKEKLYPIYKDKDVTIRKLLLLIEHFLGEKNYFNYNKIYIDENSLNNLEKALSEIINDFKPLEYIIGSCYFLNCHINVSKPLLIPRVETEYWCEVLIENLKNFKEKKLKILDMCCGTGCIGISLLYEFDNFECLFVDISDFALKETIKNAEENGVLNRIEILKSDLFEELNNLRKFDLIVTNPPYISEEKKLENSVVFWEDKDALFSKEGGLFHIKKILLKSVDYLNENGVLIIECDSETIYEVYDYAKEINKYEIIELLYDQYKVPRVIFLSQSRESFFKIEEKDIKL